MSETTTATQADICVWEWLDPAPGYAHCSTRSVQRYLAETANPVIPTRAPAHVLRRWPFVWIRLRDRGNVVRINTRDVSDPINTATALAVAAGMQIEDDDLRQAVVRAFVAWAGVQDDDPIETEAENVLINISDAAIDEQDRRNALKPIPRFKELSDAEIARATPDELRTAYRALREHHIDETTKLWERLRTKP